MVVFNLGSDYGYVVLAASGSWLLNFWQSIKIGGKRKELGIKVSSPKTLWTLLNCTFMIALISVP